MQCPIFRGKRSYGDMNNYRAIPVGSIIGKIFSSVVDNRLQCLTEDNQLRAFTQTGFRKTYGALDATFTLRHIVDKIRHLAQNKHSPALYACFY